MSTIAEIEQLIKDLQAAKFKEKLLHVKAETVAKQLRQVVISLENHSTEVTLSTGAIGDLNDTVAELRSVRGEIARLSYDAQKFLGVCDLVAEMLED